MNKRTRHLSLAALALLLLSALISCAEGPVGIFASIAAETDINLYATKAFKGTSPAFVAQLGTDYYAGIGELYKRAEGATSWTKASTNGLPGTGPFFATSGAVAGGVLYATFADTSIGTLLGVYSWNGTIWTRVDAAFPAGSEKLRSVMAANNVLFAVTATETEVDGIVTDTKHSIYSLAGTFTVSGIDEEEIGLPNAVVFSAPNYWFSAGSSIISGTTPGALDITAGAPTTIPFGGVVVTSTDVFFAGRDGKLYDSSDWSSSPAFKNPRELTYSFGIPAYVAAGGEQILLVPGQNYPTAGNTKPAQGGYLEFDAASFSAATATKTDYSLAADINNYFITLDAKSVKQIVGFDETVGKRLFAITNGDGLWSNQFNGTSWSGWRRE